MKYYTLRFLNGRQELEILTTKNPVEKIGVKVARKLIRDMGGDTVEIYESDKWGAIKDWTIKTVSI